MTELQNRNFQGSSLSRRPQSSGQTGSRQREQQPGGQQRDREEIPRPTKGEYRPLWITTAADQSMVEYAEKAGRFMALRGLTNSKIRSICGEIKRIQMSEFEKEKSAFILLKPKVAYALGRDRENSGLKLFREIFDMSSTDVTDQKSFQNFCNLMEAILAYHRAHGGKD